MTYQLPSTLVVANWKMNGSLADLDQYISDCLTADAHQGMADCVICPPSLYAAYVSQRLAGSKVACGAQDCSKKKQGAYTGDLSAKMLVDVGCTYVIVGHSERRAYCGESNMDSADKVFQALEQGLRPILCIGESKEERGCGQTNQVIQDQLAPVWAHRTHPHFSRLIVAYEPIWAIGSGVSATPLEAQAVHHYIREITAAKLPGLAKSLQILYGGSVNQQNVSALVAQPDVNGALVGGAALDSHHFIEIAKLCKESF